MPDFLEDLLNMELPFDVITHAGEGEYWCAPITLQEFLPFACYCLLALTVLGQLFIPLLRQAYAACFRFVLDLLALSSRRAESARLLADACSRFLFTGGLCSFPLALALYEDTFRPSLGGPLAMGFVFVGLALTLLLIATAFIIFAVWTLGRWQQLHRVEKRNPLADQLSQ